MTHEKDAREIAEGLSPLEIDLLLDRCADWGSWMFTAGNYMVSLGLGRKENGSIYFDTPLGLAVRRLLQEQSPYV